MMHHKINVQPPVQIYHPKRNPQLQKQMHYEKRCSSAYPGKTRVNHIDNMNDYQLTSSASSGAEDDLRYFQCSPPQPLPSKKNFPPEQFKLVIDSMQKFPTDAKPTPPPSSGNNQTFTCFHKDNLESKISCHESLNDHHVYKSNTRVLPIPNGIRVITDILKTQDNKNDKIEDQIEDNLEVKKSSRETQTELQYLMNEISFTSLFPSPIQN
ncbi:CLUMA_CG009766, isoform B [Clunio marinus]|uniref:CLUMA_CG009766, isoform B n=1 Tax=Clunio marinus TaxID=568069 RepID=A0A1J1I9U9_9DIPT|nr:CLUMA_CG009766, isoform B [Clunio marinus]